MAKLFSLLLLINSGIVLYSHIISNEKIHRLSESLLGRRGKREIDCNYNGYFSDRPIGLCSSMYYSCTDTPSGWEKRWFSCGRTSHFEPKEKTLCAPGSCASMKAGEKKTNKWRLMIGPKTTPGPLAEAKAAPEEPTTEPPSTLPTTTMAPLRPLEKTDILLSKIKLDWGSAMSYCKKAKATLLVIEEEPDNAFLNSAAIWNNASHILHDAVWSAAKFPNTDYEQLYWEPEHTQIENFMNWKLLPLKMNWDTGEPKDDGEKGQELCVDIKFFGNGKTKPIWTAADCSDQKYFICVRKPDDRRANNEDDSPIEEPVDGYPGVLVIRGVNGDEKGIKLVGTLLKSNTSDYFYFYPEKRSLLPTPLVNDKDEPYPATYKPLKTNLPLRSVDTLPAKTNGIILEMSSGRSVVFMREGSFVSGVFMPDMDSMLTTAVVSSLDGFMVTFSEKDTKGEFLPLNPRETFTGPTPGKWRPGKKVEYLDKPFAKPGHGLMGPLVGGEIVWERDQSNNTQDETR